MEQSTIEARDGKLYVINPWQSAWSEPTEHRLAWPTGLRASGFSHLIEQKCIQEDAGLFRMKNGQLIVLENRGKTKPSSKHTEERQIPKPVNCHKYRNGKWCK